MNEGNGHPLTDLWNEMKKYPGAVKLAAELSGKTTVWIRLVIRDQKFKNEELVKHCIDAVKIKREEKDRADDTYENRMKDLITKELSNENEPAPKYRSEAADNGVRHPASAG